MKAVIFDFGRTLYDRGAGRIFPEAFDILEKLSKKYRLAIVSLTTDGDMGNRIDILKENKIDHYFSPAIFVVEDKDSAYEKALKKMGVVPEDVAIVDDRVVRGIKWGNDMGAMTIWFKNGRFSDELPSKETGEPTHTITSLPELEGILL